MKCTTCGYETQPGARFCVQCGTTLPAEISDDRGTVVATCETRFDVARETLAFLSSFRPA